MCICWGWGGGEGRGRLLSRTKTSLWVKKIGKKGTKPRLAPQEQEDCLFSSRLCWEQCLAYCEVSIHIHWMSEWMNETLTFQKLSQLSPWGEKSNEQSEFGKTQSKYYEGTTSRFLILQMYPRKACKPTTKFLWLSLVHAQYLIRLLSSSSFLSTSSAILGKRQDEVLMVKAPWARSPAWVAMNPEPFSSR